MGSLGWILFSQASEASGSPEGPAAGGHARMREHVRVCEGARTSAKLLQISGLRDLARMQRLSILFYVISFWGAPRAVKRARGGWPPQRRGGLDTLAVTDEKN
jgi:hypothetical protein